MLNLLLRDLSKEMELHNAGKRKYPHWKDFVLLPLARELGQRLNLNYDVSGVFGLRLQCYISLMDKATNKCVYILSITPRFKPFSAGELELHYDTGKVHEGLPLDQNGINCITAPLPDDIEDIIRIMKVMEDDEVCQ